MSTDTKTNYSFDGSHHSQHTRHDWSSNRTTGQPRLANAFV